MPFWKTAFAILKKDLRVEFRTKEVFNSSAVFALLVIVTFSMAFEPTSEQARALSGGLLWVAFAFAAMLGPAGFSSVRVVRMAVGAVYLYLARRD